MRISGLDRYVPLETALKEVGFKVNEVEKQGKRTVITVFRYRQDDKAPVFPVLKAVPTAVPPEAPEANGL
jgi:hypothetical protein